MGCPAAAPTGQKQRDGKALCRGPGVLPSTVGWQDGRLRSAGFFGSTRCGPLSPGLPGAPLSLSGLPQAGRRASQTVGVHRRPGGGLLRLGQCRVEDCPARPSYLLDRGLPAHPSHLLANNVRFLIRLGIQIPHLASQVLAMSVRGSVPLRPSPVFCRNLCRFAVRCVGQTQGHAKRANRYHRHGRSRGFTSIPYAAIFDQAFNAGHSY